MGMTVQATNGAMLPLDSLELSLTYSGGFISALNVTYAGIEYEQDFTNDGTNITDISQWYPVGDPPPGDFMIDNNGNLMIDNNSNLMVTG